jgi:hypothetical protein
VTQRAGGRGRGRPARRPSPGAGPGPGGGIRHSVCGPPGNTESTGQHGDARIAFTPSRSRRVRGAASNDRPGSPTAREVFHEDTHQ